MKHLLSALTANRDVFQAGATAAEFQLSGMCFITLDGAADMRNAACIVISSCTARTRQIKLVLRRLYGNVRVSYLSSQSLSCNHLQQLVYFQAWDLHEETSYMLVETADNLCVKNIEKAPYVCCHNKIVLFWIRETIPPTPYNHRVLLLGDCCENAVFALILRCKSRSAVGPAFQRDFICKNTHILLHVKYFEQKFT